MTDDEDRKTAFHRIKYYLTLNGIPFVETEPNRTIECGDVTIMEGLFDPSNLVVHYFDDDMYVEEKSVVDVVAFIKGRRKHDRV